MSIFDDLEMSFKIAWNAAAFGLGKKKYKCKFVGRVLLILCVSSLNFYGLKIIFTAGLKKGPEKERYM